MAELDIEDLASTNVEELVAMFETIDARHFAQANREAALRFLAQQRDIHVVGRADGRVVAFGMLRGWEEGYEIPSLGIAVTPDAEGRGYGRAMMNALAGLARGRGASRIRLRVAEDNVRARRLYESCGYRAYGIERGENVMEIDLR